MSKKQEKKVDLNHESELAQETETSSIKTNSLEDIRGLLEKNLELSEETLKRTKYIKRYVIISQVMSTIKILIIAIPLILGIIYLPPLLKSALPMYEEAIKAYKEILGVKEQTDSIKSTVDINKVPPELRRFLE